MVIMSLVRFDPLSDFEKITNHLMGDWGFGSSMIPQGFENGHPRANVIRTDEGTRIILETAGCDPKDISVQLQRGVLTISGERVEENLDEGAAFLRRELTSGRWSRSFTVPVECTAEDIAAEYTNGVLELSVKNPEKVESSKIAITLKDTPPQKEILDKNKS
jgi:HSP20 family protein